MASWAPISQRSSAVMRVVADVVVRTAHGPSSNSTIDGTAYERSLPTVRARSKRLARHRHQAGGRPGGEAVNVERRAGVQPALALVDGDDDIGRRCALRRGDDHDRPARTRRRGEGGLDPRRGHSGWRRAGRDAGADGADRELQRIPELVDVDLGRGNGQDGTDAGERLVELGGGQLGRRRQLPVTLGGELIAAAEEAGDARRQEGDPGDQRDHPHEAHAALSARAAPDNSAASSSQRS